ncbi:MAG: hypothetical protein Q9193_003026 [Seirophora villosa]
MNLPAQGPSYAENQQSTQEEQLAAVLVEEEDLGSDGEECELHVYESKFDTRGEEVTLRAGTKSIQKPPKPQSHRACLVLTRQYSKKFRAKVISTDLEIQSQHIIRALRKVIGTYHGVDFNARIVTITEPPRCLFHYQDELRKHAEESNNQQEKSHIQLCLQYMEKTLHREIKVLKSSDSPKLEFRDLWIAFKPGCLVYHTQNDVVEISRLRSITEVMDEDDDEEWLLETEMIDYRGNHVGLTWEFLSIARYAGCKPIRELDAFPLHFHPEEERIRCDLSKRGRKYLSLWGIHHRFVPINSSTNGGGRIMLDLAQYQGTTLAPWKFVAGTKIFTSGLEANTELSDEEVMTCSGRIPGYSLDLKKWENFRVTEITEVAYNDKAFHGLVLQEQKKRLISSLLERQDYQQEDSFDDLIQGKGKGLIFLLHGPPGVGKTYTAGLFRPPESRTLVAQRS